MSDEDKKENPAAKAEEVASETQTPAPELQAPAPEEKPVEQTITLSASLNLMIRGFDSNINACLPEIAKTVRKLKKIEGVEASSIILTVFNKETNNQNRYQMLVGNKKRPDGREDFQVMPL